MITLLFAIYLLSYQKLGLSGAQFLQIGMGARAEALGEAVVATTDGVSSIYWNPGGLARISSYEVFGGYTRGVESITFSHSAVALKRGNYAYGLFLITMTMDPIEITTVQNPDGIGESYSASGTAFGGGVSMMLTDRLSVGFVGKVVRDQIFNCSATGFAVDVGSLFEFVKDGFALGLSLANFGTDMQLKGRDLSLGFKPENLGTIFYETAEYSLPLTMRVGLSYPFRVSEGVKGLLLFQSEHPNDNKERYAFGSEFVINDILAIRGGYILGHDTKDYSAGVGLSIPVTFGDLILDFAYVNRTVFKPEVYFSVKLRGR